MTQCGQPGRIPGGIVGRRKVGYRGERVDVVVAHLELGIAARHAALFLHGPSPDPSPFYTLPRSAADLGARSELIRNRRHASTWPGAAPAQKRLALMSLASDLVARDFAGYQNVLAIHAEASLEA